MTQEEVKVLFKYLDGHLYWRDRKKGRRADRPVGTTDTAGYRRVSLTTNGIEKIHYVHRLVYLYHYGSMPTGVDHIDGNPGNNKVENLRAASQQQNLCNVRAHKDNPLGIKNLHWDRARSRWRVSICAKGRKIQKRVVDFEAALTLAAELREKFHGDFARHEG